VQSSGRIGIFIAAASLGTVLGGYLFKRFSGASMQRWLACSLAAFGVAYLGISLAPGIQLGLPLDAMGQVGGGIMLPTLIAWSLGKYRFEHRGRGMGLWGGAFFLGAFVSPPVLSLLDKFTPGFLASIGVVGVLCLLIAGGLFWRSKLA
jgi:hypothetical protein